MTGITVASNQTKGPSRLELREKGDRGFGHDASDSPHLMLQKLLDGATKIIDHEEELQTYEDQLNEYQVLVDQRHAAMTAAERQWDQENSEKPSTVASMQRTVEEAREIIEEIANPRAEGGREFIEGYRGEKYSEGDTEEAHRNTRGSDE